MTIALANPKTKRGDTDYERLKHDLAKGLFEAQNARFLIRLVSRLVTFFAILATFVWTVINPPGALMMPATILLGSLSGVFMTQLATCAHDVGHKSTLRGKRTNYWVSLFVGPFILGISYTWWNIKHNFHHLAPNREGTDTDIEFPIIAFSLAQALKKKKSFRLILEHQHQLIFPLFALQAINSQLNTVIYLFQGPKDVRNQAIGVTLHWLAVGTLIYFTGWVGVIFMASQVLIHGLCNASIFAPNHKGLDLIPADAPEDRMRDQIEPSRNVHGGKYFGWLVEFWYGGLQWQIEHHLFMTMPVGNLKKTTATVKAHCEKLDITYRSATPLQSYLEMYRWLRGVAHEYSKHNKALRLNVAA